ncbi:MULTISPECIES: D-2-hydroxyacid dehydrogenase [unclassified Paenibacillus]|uniref:D-2-hydroxyacid dehydrogenase n=1 Tax=unclassified Paenibacillus TaxID=185978 RepID=UPI001AE4FE8B|nr:MULTISPECIES: D-2-hydroxyacid dehydrogenase [unclassified Paenibacillus]
MKIHKILVTGRLYEEMKRLMAGRSDKEFRFLPDHEVSEADFVWADAYVAFKPTVNFRFGHLQWVHAMGAGVDAFLHGREWKEDVLLTRTTGPFGRKISEYCLSYMLSELQVHKELRHNAEQRKWNPLTPKPLSGQKVVICGTGEIGQEIARTLSAFGVIVSGVSRSGTKQPFFAQNVAWKENSEVLSEADWVINTLPLTMDTIGLFDADLFYTLRHCGFINVGRGASVREDALIAAVKEGHVRLAVLDVFAEEPLPAESPLWNEQGIVITPHISAVTTPEEAMQSFIDTLTMIEEGCRLPINLVNPKQGY